MKMLSIRNENGILVANITNSIHIAEILTSVNGEWKTGKYEHGMKNYLLVKEGFRYGIGNDTALYVWENYRIFVEG